ncbi:hypothetical protein WDU94_001739 [Cyamophila willieti]
MEKKLLSDFCDEESLIGDGLGLGAGEWETVKNFMIKVTQPCDSMIRLCLWHGDPINCSRIFYPSLTDEGMCCSFNKVRNEFIFKNPKDTSDLNSTLHYPSVDWTLENDFPDGAPLDSIPWRPWGAGRHLGLSVVLDANIDEYYCSSEASYGFKVRWKIQREICQKQSSTKTLLLTSPDLNQNKTNKFKAYPNFGAGKRVQALRK